MTFFLILKFEVRWLPAILIWYDQEVKNKTSEYIQPSELDTNDSFIYAPLKI